MLAGSVLDAAPEQKRRVAIMRIFGRVALATSVSFFTILNSAQNAQTRTSPRTLTTNACVCVGMRDEELQGWSQDTTPMQKLTPLATRTFPILIFDFKWRPPRQENSRGRKKGTTVQARQNQTENHCADGAGSCSREEVEMKRGPR